MAGNSVAKPVEETVDQSVKEYTLTAPRIRATFIPYGARLTSLQVPDREGNWKEVVVGHKDVAEYKKEAAPTYYGCVVGRYANRIANAKFTIDGVESTVGANEHDGRNMLHGGIKGYDAREWTVVNVGESSVTFSLLDEAFEGFPGNVLATATYTVSEGKLTTALTAKALDKPTPLLLTTHTFFRIGSDVEGSTLEDSLHLPGSSRYIAVDDICIPTGEVVDVTAGDHPFNFTTAAPLKKSLAALGLCGAGSVGIDNCFVFDQPQAPEAPTTGSAQVVWSSPATGIRLSVHTNQPATQLYSGLHFNGSQESQVGKVDKYGCLAIEPQGWIDGINHPEWKQNQVYTSASGPHVNVSEYVFDTVA